MIWNLIRALELWVAYTAQEFACSAEQHRMARTLMQLGITEEDIEPMARLYATTDPRKHAD